MFTYFYTPRERFTHFFICRERRLRVIFLHVAKSGSESGKFLRVKSRYPESFEFLCLWRTCFLLVGILEMLHSGFADLADRRRSPLSLVHWSCPGCEEAANVLLPPSHLLLQIIQGSCNLVMTRMMKKCVMVMTVMSAMMMVMVKIIAKMMMMIVHFCPGHLVQLVKNCAGTSNALRAHAPSYTIVFHHRNRC